jgi:hypothetical protein
VNGDGLGIGVRARLVPLEGLGVEVRILDREGILGEDAGEGMDSAR